MRLLGLAVLVIGIVLLALGINATQGINEEVIKAATGRYSNQTIGFIVAGIVLIIGGLVLAVRRRI